MALVGVAWLTLVVGLRWQLRTKVVAAFPGLATLAVALAGAVAVGDARQASARQAEYDIPLMVARSRPSPIRYRRQPEEVVETSVAATPSGGTKPAALIGC